MPRTIVIKSARNFNSNDMGNVIPIAIENDDGSVTLVGPDDYPNNNKIFISKEYSKIDSSFGERELFILTTVNESRDDENENSASHSKYFSMGFYATSLDTNTYLPIIPMSMPDVSSGRVEKGPPIDIGNKHFFILNDGMVSGPFIAQAEEESWLVTPTNTTSPLALSSYHIAAFNLGALDSAHLLLKCTIGGFEGIFFTSLKKAKEEVPFQVKDFIPDSALIRLFAKMDYGKSTGNLTKSEASKLAAIIDSYSKKTKVAGDNERTRRIRNVLGDYLKFEGVGVDIVQEYLNTKAGKEFVENYATANRQSLLKDTIASIEQKHLVQRDKLERETAEISARYEAKRQEHQQFELDMEKSKKEILNRIETLNAQTREQEKNALRDRNNKLMADIEMNERVLEDFKAQVGEYKEISLRKKESEKLEARVDYLREQEYKLKGYVDTQMNLIGNPQVADRLVEFRTIQMLLNGISPENNDIAIKPAVLTKFPNQVAGETRKSYIHSLKDSLDQSAGRPYSYDEVANLVLCSLQSYLTILAGPPGTGKTSTVTRFAETLGLCAKKKSSTESDNFLSIPVGRGWVSSRDMLGFYNSLKNSYQPSRSGLYQFLKVFSEKNENEESKDFLKLVLLDEANLSNIEHYWSDFLLICDSFELNNKIDLGVGGGAAKDRFLNIPSSLRFMATINNDSTVESLSNRLIDRAAIISLSYGMDSSPLEVQGEVLSGAVPYADLMDAFYPSKDDEEMQPIEALRLKQVLEILSVGKGSQIHFSKRKTNAITKYCHMANQLGFERVEPLDFAISQHILPSIAGHGQGLKERLLMLETKLDEFKYSVSRKLVSGIIEGSEDFSDSYSFF